MPVALRATVAATVFGLVGGCHDATPSRTEDGGRVAAGRVPDAAPVSTRSHDASVNDVVRYSANDVVAGICTVQPILPKDTACHGVDQFTACTMQKCDGARCATPCRDFVACASSTDHICDPSCPMSDDCSACLQRTFTCSALEQGCFAFIACDQPTTKGGPCDHVAACCDSQSDPTVQAMCSQAVATATQLAGDVGCKQMESDPGTYCFFPCALPDGSVPAAQRPECQGLMRGTPP